MTKQYWLDAWSATTAGDVWLFFLAMIVLIVGVIWKAMNE